MKRRKRSLTHTGGATRTAGDPAPARELARCLDVDPRAAPPFTHGFHAYPARMHPETARRALEAFAAGRVLDPFVGSGTVALEAVRRGSRFSGLDVSPVAIEVAWARTRVLPPAECREVESEGRRLAAKGRAVWDRAFDLPEWARAEREWYSPHTLREVCVLKALIDRVGRAALRRLLACALSSIVVKLSRQLSDSDAKADRAFRPRPPGTTFRWFAERCTELTLMLLRLSSDLHKRGVRFVEPELRQGDARSAALPPADLIVTSPPYAGTYDYLLHHERRYPILGVTPAGHEIGARREEGRGYAGDMDRALANMLGALAPGGRIVMLVGDGAVEGRPLRADALMGDLAAAHGARRVASASQRRPGGREEHLLLIERV